MKFQAFRPSIQGIFTGIFVKNKGAQYAFTLLAHTQKIFEAMRMKLQCGKSKRNPCLSPSPRN